MKSFLIACVAALVIAIGAGIVLNGTQMQSEHAFTSPTGVRL
jgi:hypothetical protein